MSRWWYASMLKEMHFYCTVALPCPSNMALQIHFPCNICSVVTVNGTDRIHFFPHSLSWTLQLFSNLSCQMIGIDVSVMHYQSKGRLLNYWHGWMKRVKTRYQTSALSSAGFDWSQSRCYVETQYLSGFLAVNPNLCHLWLYYIDDSLIFSLCPLVSVYLCRADDISCCVFQLLGGSFTAQVSHEVDGLIFQPCGVRLSL